MKRKVRAAQLRAIARARRHHPCKAALFIECPAMSIGPSPPANPAFPVDPCEFQFLSGSAELSVIPCGPKVGYLIPSGGAVVSVTPFGVSEDHFAPSGEAVLCVTPCGDADPSVPFSGDAELHSTPCGEVVLVVTLLGEVEAWVVA